MTGYSGVLQEVRAVSGSVVLVAVSKTHPYEAVMEAYAEGARIFGENRVQEAEAKFPPMGERPEGMRLYLIGQLQRNKVRKALQIADRIESVDSLPLIDKIEKEAAALGRTIEVLLELNSSGEEQKAGFRTEEEALAAAGHIMADCPHIILKGLMTVGPLGYDRERNREAFSYAHKVFAGMNSLSSDCDVLSMGMSADWQQALACGSTEVRIGTAIFGARA